MSVTRLGCLFLSHLRRTRCYRPADRFVVGFYGRFVAAAKEKKNTETSRRFVSASQPPSHPGVALFPLTRRFLFFSFLPDFEGFFFVELLSDFFFDYVLPGPP